MAFMAAAAPFISLASGALSGGMAFMQGQYQASVAEMNAKVAKQNAEYATVKASIEAQNKDMETKGLLGEQVVAQAASGVSLSGRSALQTRQSARRLGRADAENIIAAGSAERENFLQQKRQFSAEAKASKLSSWAGLAGGVLEGVGGAIDKMPPRSMVGGATSVARPIPKPTLINPLLRRKAYA
jgi:hypothetical protein